MSLSNAYFPPRPIQCCGTEQNLDCWPGKSEGEESCREGGERSQESMREKEKERVGGRMGMEGEGTVF